MKNKENYLYLGKLLIISVYLLIIQGFYPKETPPKNLFILYPGETRALEQEKERLKYGELLQPEISWDSLIVPNVKNVPAKYKEYVEAFVDTLNRHLKNIPKENRDQILIAFKLNSIGTTLVNSYIEKKDSSYILTITREDALSLGLEKEYDETRKFVENLNATLPYYPQDLVSRIEKIYEKPRSIFWDSRFFNGNVDAFYAIRKSILN